MRVKIAVTSLLLLLAFSIPWPVAGQSGIVVNGADSLLTLPTTYSQGLADAASSVTPRVVFQYANSDAHCDLLGIPTALQSLVNAVAPRVIVEYSNSTGHHTLLQVPAALQTLIEGVSARIVFQYANSSQSYALSYPITLMNDTTPPQISNISANPVSNDTATITWTTDEFADSQVSYGVQSGQYTGTGSDPLYAKQHVITLTAMIPGTTYYYRVRSADQSNNTSTSSENSFKFQTLLDTLEIEKSVTPTGQVQCGKELTYTVVISAAQGASLGLYDPLTDTTFVRFVARPTGIVSTSHSVTGTFSMAAAQPVTVTFVVRVDVPLSAGTVDVTNQACVYVPPDSGTCKVSNQVTNQAFRPYRIFLPVVLRNR
jgi:hypothetical protein